MEKVFKNNFTAAIIPYYNKKEAHVYADEIIKYLSEYGCCFNVPEKFRDILKSDNIKFFQNEFEAVENSDIAISIGGDGTIIHTAKNAAVSGKLVLGVNCGRVGFVAGLEKSEISMLSNLFSGNYTVDERMMLEVNVTKNSGFGLSGVYKSYALNDVTLTNGAVARMVDIDVKLNGEFITSYRADGVILATPTGSTAYSLSAGGPVIEPHMKCILLTPICPHSLFSRSVLFSDDSEVTLSKGEYSREEPYVSIDGQKSDIISENDTVTLKKADISANFINFGKKNFYRILNDKLNERMG